MNVLLSALESFGDVAAEDDAVLDYFLSTDAVGAIAEGKAFLVLGRKGTGKTAIVRFFTENIVAAMSARPLNLRYYPWPVHAKRVDFGASDTEAYVSSWRYLIAVQIATLTLLHAPPKSNKSARMLRQYFLDNYGGSTPELADILRPKKLKLSALSLRPSIMGNQLGGVDLDRSENDFNFGVELNALASSILEAAVDVAKTQNLKSLSLHFDELDQGLSRLDDQRSRMLIGLILAARQVRRECLNAGCSVNPVVYLRTDIWEDLQFSDKNKISQTSTFHLIWSRKSLLDVINTRLEAKLGPSVKWDVIIDAQLMRGSQKKWDHIVARTFNRPRDVIQFLNIILAKAKDREQNVSIIENKDIVNAREEYSRYLKQELDDEVQPHWPLWLEAIQACSTISTITFDKEDFVRAYNNRKSSSNAVSAEEALLLLYRFSIIGYERRIGYGGSGWTFQYVDPDAGWDNAASRFKVHLGLKEFARLREERGSTLGYFLPGSDGLSDDELPTYTEDEMNFHNDNQTAPN